MALAIPLSGSTSIDTEQRIPDVEREVVEPRSHWAVGYALDSAPLSAGAYDPDGEPAVMLSSTLAFGLAPGVYNVRRMLIGTDGFSPFPDGLGAILLPFTAADPPATLPAGGATFTTVADSFRGLATSITGLEQLVDVREWYGSRPLIVPTGFDSVAPLIYSTEITSPFGVGETLAAAIYLERVGDPPSLG